MISKSIARERGRQRRKSLDEQVRRHFDASIIARCKNELQWNDYERMMLFLPIERQHEINLWPLVRWIWAEWPAVEVYVPRVNGAEMQAVRITPLTNFATNKFGIPEPVAGEMLDGPLDLVLVPLLGFDAAGHRVGYGKGYFDKFLAGQAAAERIGLGYECLYVPEGIAAEAHDVALHSVITEDAFRQY